MSDASRGLHRQASALAARGRLAEAIPVWGEALRQDPADVDVLVSLGHALAAVAEHAHARELAERAAGLAPETSAPWYLLGALALDQARFVDAIEALTLAAQRAAGEEVAACAIALGKAYAAAGHPQKAVAAVAAIDTAAAHILRAHALVEAGDVAGAIPALQRAGELEPDHPEPYKRLAVLVAEREPSLARELARHALALAPDDAEARDLVTALGL